MRIKDSNGFVHSAVPSPVLDHYYNAQCGSNLTTKEYSVIVRYSGHRKCKVVSDETPISCGRCQHEIYLRSKLRTEKYIL